MWQCWGGVILRALLLGVLALAVLVSACGSSEEQPAEAPLADAPSEAAERADPIEDDADDGGSDGPGIEDLMVREAELPGDFVADAERSGPHTIEEVMAVEALTPELARAHAAGYNAGFVNAPTDELATGAFVNCSAELFMTPSAAGLFFDATLEQISQVLDAPRIGIEQPIGERDAAFEIAGEVSSFLVLWAHDRVTSVCTGGGPSIERDVVTSAARAQQARIETILPLLDVEAIRRAQTE